MSSTIKRAVPAICCSNCQHWGEGSDCALNEGPGPCSRGRESSWDRHSPGETWGNEVCPDGVDFARKEA